MINRELFQLLSSTPHISGQIQKIPMAIVPPTERCYGYLEKGFAYEFYQTDKNKQLVSWFWTDDEFVIPTSPYSKIVLSCDAEFYELPYGDTFRSLRTYEGDRAYYYFTRARHKLQIAERISDIQYASPFKNYRKLRQKKPQVFDYASEEQIASFLNITVGELRGFMFKQRVSL